MYDYESISKSLQKKIDSYELTYERACEINDLAYEKYSKEFEEVYTEASETVNKIAGGVAKASGVAAGVADVAGGAVVKQANASGEKIAKVVLKKPPINAPKEAIEKYEKNMNRIKNAFKIGEVVAINTVLMLVPCTNAPFDAAFIAAVANSDDPADKALVSKISKIAGKDGNSGKFGTISEKLKGFLNGLKNKIFTEEDQKKLKQMYLSGLNLVKDFDTNVRKWTAKRGPTVTGATFHKRNFEVSTEAVIVDNLSSLVFNESGMLNDDYLDIIESFIRNTDYDDMTSTIVENYLETL